MTEKRWHSEVQKAINEIEAEIDRMDKKDADYFASHNYNLGKIWGLILALKIRKRIENDGTTY